MTICLLMCVLLHKNNFIQTVYTKLMRNVSNYIIQIHFKVLHAWSRLVELPSSDEMKMFYTEHYFQVDLENLRVQLEISCRENTLYCDTNRYVLVHTKYTAYNAVIFLYIQDLN